MIKFFRHIRQRMIKENRVSRYLLYAIGEILLVVIGILIALQINNHNEQLKVLAKEQKYLASLKEEFEFNKVQLEKVFGSNAIFGDAARDLLQFTGPDVPRPSEEEFIRLFLRMINAEVQYRPSDGVLHEIISSGKLEIFRDPELRNALSSWDGILYTVRFQENELNSVRMVLIDLVSDHGNVRQLFHTTMNDRFELAPSGFTSENRDLLGSRVFENRTMAFLATSRFTNDHYYSMVEKKIDVILELIERSLNP